LTVGVAGTSLKENEQRVPIHPAHLPRIPENIRKYLVFEEGYGKPFGMPDEELKGLSGGLISRDALLRDSEIVLLPKPLAEDLKQIHEGGILWGWPHCVQGFEATQIAIDRKLTMIAWEAMFSWLPGGARDLHSFYKNNELAGFCGVIHALGLLGIDGHYGPRRRAVVLSLGSVSRGAIYALQGRGFRDITVFTQRPPHLVRDHIYGCELKQMRRGGSGEAPMVAVAADGTTRPLLEELEGADVIVNGILQDTDAPLMYLREGEHEQLKRDCLIVDGSCDLKMGFPFARPTSFEEPMFDVGHVHYYAVDHTPTYLWNSASWEISLSLLPYLRNIMEGPAGWKANETVRRAIEIQDGVIQNPNILNFQKREATYPHNVLKG
jgi:alanine dehydrogenase